MKNELVIRWLWFPRDLSRGCSGVFQEVCSTLTFREDIGCFVWGSLSLLFTLWFAYRWVQNTHLVIYSYIPRNYASVLSYIIISYFLDFQKYFCTLYMNNICVLKWSCNVSHQYNLNSYYVDSTMKYEKKTCSFSCYLPCSCSKP